MYQMFCLVEFKYYLTYSFNLIHMQWECPLFFSVKYIIMLLLHPVLYKTVTKCVSSTETSIFVTTETHISHPSPLVHVFANSREYVAHLFRKFYM